MYKNRTQVRVRYGETDQMGVVYYGVYAQYFEVGRVEALRELGLSYREMEEQGVMLPVSKLEVNYHRPAKYDDLLTIETTITEMPGAKIDFDYRVFNAEDVLLTTGKVTLVFVSADRMRPRKAPAYFLEKIGTFFT